MKKITFLFALFCISIGYSQMPTTAAPTPPARNAADVISIYGSAYTNITGVNTNPGWGQSTVVTEIQVAGDNTLQYANFNYQGTDWAGTPQNISGFEFLHVDVWTNAQAPNVFAISSGAEIPHAISSVPGSWQSLDIPVAGLTGNPNSVIQFKFDGGTGGTIYLDNLYFWKSPLPAGSDATLSDLKVDGITIPGFSPSATSYTYELVVGTTTVPQITLATTTDSAANAVINQATSIPGNATVVVTSQNGNVNATYTVSFVASLPNPSPTPSTPNAEVLNIYSDTGNFTNTWVKDYDFGVFQSKPDLDPTAGVNEAIKMNFATAGYGEGTNGVTDISTYNWVHFDYFADSNSSEIRFILIKNNGGAVTEHFYELTTAGSNGTLIQSSWQSVNIPLSFFEGIGFNKTQFFQFKLGTSSDLVSDIVYFDNIYFSVNQATVLKNNNFEATTFTAYPNPAQDQWNINATQNINSILLFDVTGKQILSLKPNNSSATINASDLSSGIYFANISTENGTKVIKLIKN
ncbi:T9SS type A sorting domain-containing protein [Flavobacterium ponti]|uniref:T9SS type A sorting domain-containing protein n=1 Tax=Flavobacterium ponti TaxID=665133 RepID=A0ABV9P7B4_9FLAO